MIHRSDDQIAKHIRNTSTQPFLNFSLCLKSFRGMFQSLKSYRFAYISVICINVICDFVVVLVSFTSYCSSSKLSRPLWHFDMSFSRTKLERTGSGYKCVWQITFTQIHHYHQCLIVGMAVRRPLVVKQAIKSRKPSLVNNNNRWRCFPWKPYMGHVYSLFPGEKCP